MRLIKHRLMVLDDGARTKTKQNKTHFWVTFEKYSFSSPACENTNSVSLAKGQVTCIFNKQPRKF